MLKFSALCLFILTALQLSTYANQGDLQSITRQIYQRTGLSANQVPYNHFEAAYHRYLQGRQNREFTKPLISFVNFGLQGNTTKRYFLVDVSSNGARLVFETYVTHGQNSGPVTNAHSFGNVPESLKSSLGFFKVAEEYMGANGRSIRVDGLSGSLNSNARDRYIVLHSGPYVTERNGASGRSWGCFVVPFSVRDSIFNTIVSGSMLYAFRGNEGASPSGSTAGLEAVAQADTEPSGASVTPGDPAPTLNDTSLAGARPSMAAQGLAGDHMNLAPGTGVAGQSSMDFNGDGEPDNFEVDDPQIVSDGNAPLRGNDAFERCQSYADRPWSEVVRLTNEGQDPHQFFRGSWHDMERESIYGDNITYSAGAAAATHHLGVVNECAAMAMMADPNNFNQEDPNAVKTLRSKDGEIECQYRGAEAVDFTQCQEIIKAHDALSEAERELHRNQNQQYQTSGEEAVRNLKSGINIQGNSAVAASDLAKNAARIAGEREDFQTARLNALAGELAAMPNYNSLLAKCRERSKRFPQGALIDFKAFISTIPDITIPIPDLGDACQRALGRIDVKYIQNKKAKDQTKNVLKKLGYNIEELQGQNSELQRQKHSIDDSTLKGPSLPDFYMPELTLHEGPGEKPDNLPKFGFQKGSSNDQALIPLRSPREKTSFSYPKFQTTFSNDKAANERALGVNQGLIANYQVDHREKLKENTQRFFSLAKSGSLSELINFMKANGLTLEDIEYAYQKNIIDQKRFNELSKELKDRLGQVSTRRNVDYDINPALINAQWQIEKDSAKSLFDIISHRYFKQTHLQQ